jgi:hypothetical protein
MLGAYSPAKHDFDCFCYQRYGPTGGVFALLCLNCDLCDFYDGQDAHQLVPRLLTGTSGSASPDASGTGVMGFFV